MERGSRRRESLPSYAVEVHGVGLERVGETTAGDLEGAFLA